MPDGPVAIGGRAGDASDYDRPEGGCAVSKTASHDAVVAGVRLSHPDKILYSDQGTTKSELADYYVAVAERMLPHVGRRPITMVRCPTGQEGKCFFQRHAGSGVPKQLKQIDVPGFEEPY